jgi:hypothetical protein
VINFQLSQACVVKKNSKAASYKLEKKKSTTSTAIAGNRAPGVLGGFFGFWFLRLFFFFGSTGV